MNRIIVILLIILSAAFSYAPKEGFTERPEFFQGKILIKLTAQAFNSHLLRIDNSSKSYSATGIASIDKLNTKHNASGMKQPFIKAAGKTAGEFGFERWFILDIPEEKDIRSVLEDYKKDPNIESASPEGLAYPAFVPNDFLYDESWGHNNTSQLYSYNWAANYHDLPQVGTAGFDTNIQEGWDGLQGFGSSDVIIAIIDSGVDYNHEDLYVNCVQGYDYGENDSSPFDNIGHGTCCAGIAAARTDNSIGVAGVAGNCKIMPLKVTSSSGSYLTTAITNALIHCGNNNVDVANCSFGFDCDMGAYPSMDDANAYAYNNGAIIIASAGNDNKSSIMYPAIHTNVISVGAASPDDGRKRSSSYSGHLYSAQTDPNGYTIDGERWWGSHYGSDTKDARQAVDLIAPTILPSTDMTGNAGYVESNDDTEPYGDPLNYGNYMVFFNGTSCSAPYVSGFAALIKSRFPDFTPDQVRNFIRKTASDVVNSESSVGWDRYSGYGIADVGSLVSPYVFPPHYFSADCFSSGQINLFWTKNENSDDVMILYSETDEFGVPTDGTPYTTGSTITGGGKVIYKGSSLSFVHTDLDPDKLYYYRCYSVDATEKYSAGRAVNIRTDHSAFVTPLNENFNSSFSLPDAWKIIDRRCNDRVWKFGTHTSGLGGGTGNYAYLNSYAYDRGIFQDADLVTPPINVSSVGDVTLSFSYYYRHAAGSLATLSYSIDGGETWTQIQQWTETTANPSSFSQMIPAVSGQSNVKFKWNYVGSYCYYWDIDNISITSGTVIAKPNAPELISPSDNSGISYPLPLFDWNESSGADSYNILVDNNSDFSSPEINQSPSASAYAAEIPLAGGVYYWKVSATNSFGTSDYSGVRTFTVHVPDIYLSTAAITASALPEGNDNDSLFIENVGSGTLDYNINVNYQDLKKIKGSGEPDIFGYSWKDSDEPDGPDYDWVEISGVGTVVPLVDEAESGAISMGMTFNFYGTDYTSVYIADNGAITFTAVSIPYTNAAIPSSLSPNGGIIAPFWEDLDCGSVSSGDVYYYCDSSNARFIVEYNAIVNYLTTTTNTFQVLLYENGSIVFQYKEMNGTLTGCTVGIENSNGTDGSQIAYNTAYLKNNLAVRIYVAPTWLSLDTATGSVTYPDTDTVRAYFSAEGLAIGVYTADIIITSNDYDNPKITVPVTFAVSDILSAPLDLTVLSATAAEVNLSWNSVQGASIYKIYRSADPYGGFALIDTSPTNNWKDYDVSGSDKYFYYVTADNTKHFLIKKIFKITD